MLEIYEYVGMPVEYRESMLKIALCESEFHTDALGDHGNSRGLHQIQEIWFDLAGESWDSWNDPVVNSRVAIRVIQYDVERGYDPYQQWTCKYVL